MPHPTLGRVGWFLGPGGMAEGPPQAVQLRKFRQKRIDPHIALVSSIGAFNRFHENPIVVWQNHFTSPWDAYEFHPAVREVLEKVLRTLPKSPFRRHSSYKELFSDFRGQFHNLVQFLAFIVRAGGSISKIELNPARSPDAFMPFLRIFIEEAKRIGLDKIPSIFDPSPLVTTLRKEVDLKRLFEQDSTTLILTESSGGEHIFSAGANLTPEALSKIDAKVHNVSSEDQLFKAALASAAVRPFFAPVKINGDFYWDTGDINPFPVEYLMDAGCDTIFAFIKNYWAYSSRPDMNAWEALVDRLEKATQKIFLRSYKSAVNRAASEGRKLYTIIPQSLHPDADLLWISKEAIEHAIKIEDEATEKWLRDNLNIE